MKLYLDIKTKIFLLILVFNLVLIVALISLSLTLFNQAFTQFAVESQAIKETSQASNHLRDTLNLVNKQLIVIGLIALIIAMILSYIIAKKFADPLKKLKNIFIKGAQGDLSVRASIIKSSSEIKEVADSFNQMMDRISELTYRDLLTGVLNFSYFQDKLSLALDNLESDEKLVLFTIGIDDFKTINDNYGYHTGDKIIKKLANRLIRSLDDNVVARHGDEFFLYFTESTKRSQIINLGREILDRINQPYEIEGMIIYITASLGIAIYPQAGTTNQILIKHASMAMHLVKNRSEQKMEIYSANMEEKLSKRLKLEAKLQEGLEKEHFLLHYQPLFNSKAEEIVGVEALIRWQEPGVGMISPGKFIPIAERNGMIVKIGDWVLKRACKQLKKWHQLGYEDIYISINIAPQQFSDDDFVHKVESILLETKLDPSYLELEITERATMKNIEHTINMLGQLRELGVKIAIDDFGTGYSSLSYLKEFAITKLKIDKSFVMDLTTNSKNLAITETIIMMAHNLNLEVTAEGVENNGQLERLKEQGCDTLQGYFLSLPLPENDLLKLLKIKK
ncbi:diguanylate cyclase (GGDEF) domain-containing protein [Halobacteroides halobius DSM 5150]|uniref:Diguanylate cyclase (GGDEF) domain-containing protein n=1 Tax=Halobacteroides halobius (strain ATCC 35273 / DSM 5150 / MD-1) TaxID=748449 RepID=L0K9S8_HALHC|nr:bifunctional diguanylate cyclase/phosphodiesterase [Halobacteroides halobius]AGB40843.1 diguanylate cyclase (GGDEF) domain-containing protein [Halobacteroides halobius DSM 5150]